jgi:hypothetical protein
MTVRAKMKVASITEQHWTKGKVVKLQAEYDATIPEDQRFAQATPSGSMEMHIDNPAALAQFELGKDYYLDFTPVPAPENTAAPPPSAAPEAA